MRRITVRHEDGSYSAADMAAAIRQLGRLEDMYQALVEEREKTAQKLEQLRDRGTRSVARQQLLANKLMLQNLIDRFEIYAGE